MTTEAVRHARSADRAALRVVFPWRPLTSSACAPLPVSDFSFGRDSSRLADLNVLLDDAASREGVPTRQDDEREDDLPILAGGWGKRAN